MTMLGHWREHRRRRKIVNELLAAYDSGDPGQLDAWDQQYMTQAVCDRILAAVRELEEQEQERHDADRHG
jgi:hypothetical protein